MANSCGDNAISTTAFTIEALIHLRESNSAESIEQSQRALAAARSSQLDRNAQTIPQLVAMMHFVDLCCSLQHFDGGQVTSKMLAMQASLDHTANDNSWTEDGVCVIPIRRDASTNLNCDEDNQGVLRTASNGSTIFLIHWLPREDMYTLGYLLSGAAVANRNAMDGQKSEQYLKEGIRTLQGKRDTTSHRHWLISSVKPYSIEKAPSLNHSPPWQLERFGDETSYVKCSFS